MVELLHHLTTYVSNGHLHDRCTLPTPRCQKALQESHHGYATRPDTIPQVTLPVFQAVARGQAASSVLCASAGCRLLAVDVGIDGELGELIPEPGQGEHIEVLSRKVRAAQAGGAAPGAGVGWARRRACRLGAGHCMARGCAAAVNCRV